MSAGLSKKALREIAEAQKNSDFDFFMDEQNTYSNTGDDGSCYLRFTVQDGIYIGQTHVLRIKFIYGRGEYNYPKDPPNIVFVTPIYHTNIAASGGSICLDVIKSDAWSPMYGLNAIFASIVLLLDEPNVNSPFNGDAASAYHDRVSDELYSEQCREYYEKQLLTNPRAQQLLNAPEFE